MTQRYLILILVVIFFISCKKEPIQYTFGGTVTESPNHNALSNVLVKVEQRVYNGNVAASIFSSGGQSSTDALGNFEISFEREKVVEFKISFSKAGYFTEDYLINSGDVKTDETKIMNAELDPESYIKFHLNNLSGMTTDIFTMIHYNFKTDCDGCSTNDFHYYEGIVDTTFIIKTNGNIYTKYSYKNPGGAVFIQDSVFTIPFDTVDVNINY